ELRELERRQRWIVGERAEAARGVPLRHLAAERLLFDLTSPGTNLVVGRERHRRGTARRVADGAVRLENRADVARVRDGGGRGILRRRTHGRADEDGCYRDGEAEHTVDWHRMAVDSRRYLTRPRPASVGRTARAGDAPRKRLT